MRGILKFDLPEEERDFRLAIDAWKYRSIIAELRQWLREDAKHSETKETSPTILEKLDRLCAEYNVELY